jgi:hypothetical protein
MVEMLTLHPAERVALIVAKGQAERNVPVTPNVAMMLVLTIERLTGVSDWTADGDWTAGGK